MPEEQIFQILRRYEPLNAQVDLSQAGGPVADYMYKIVTDDGAFTTYQTDPAAALTTNGLDPARMDVQRFSDLASQLRERLKGGSRWTRVADSITQKETNEGQSANWDHSSSWLMNKDGYNVLYDQGHDSSTDSTSEAGTNTKFDGVGIRNPAEILRHELNLLFFPAQPLVTPGLVEQIRNEVEGGNR